MNRTISTMVLAVMCTMAARAGSCIDLPLLDDPGTSAVTLLLDRANIEVDLVPDCEPSLAAGVDGPDGLVAPDLTIAGGGGGVQISREPAREGEQPPQLRISLTLDPAQSLRIEGHHLRVSVTGEAVDSEIESEQGPRGRSRRKERDADQEKPGDGGTAVLQLVTDDSQVELHHTGAVSAQGVNTSVTALGCRGPMTIDLQYGFADISRHQGPITLQGERNGFRLTDHSGRVTSRVEGGSLTAKNGRGAFNATLEEAGLQLEAWEGPSSITGNYSSADIRESGGTQLVVTGRVLDVGLEGWQGPVVGRFTEGSLSGGEWDGGAKLDLDDTSLELDGLSGRVDLTLTNQSRARFSRVAGALSVEAQGGSELEVDGVEKIALEASDSFIWLRNVSQMKKLKLSGCDAELDLTALENRRQAISLTGATTAEVLLASPCLVDLKGGGAQMATGVILLGCEMASSQRRRSNRTRVSLEGERATTLTAKLDEEVALTVRGRP